MSKCTNCGSEKISERNSIFEFNHNGSSISIDDVQTYCEDCKNISYVGSQISTHEFAIAEAIRKADNLLSADELRVIRLKYGMRQIDMEKALGLGPKTWTRWERGKITPTKATDKFIRILSEYPNFAQILFANAEVESEQSRLIFKRFEEEANKTFKEKIIGKYINSIDSNIIEDIASDYRNSENIARYKLNKERAVA